MNPKGNHGLGEYFLKRFIKMLARLNNNEQLNSLIFDIEMSDDLNDVGVRREWEHMDIGVISESVKHSLTIENKFLSGEHSNQLER